MFLDQRDKLQIKRHLHICNIFIDELKKENLSDLQIRKDAIYQFQNLTFHYQCIKDEIKNEIEEVIQKIIKQYDAESFKVNYFQIKNILKGVEQTLMKNSIVAETSYTKTIKKISDLNSEKDILRLMQKLQTVEYNYNPNIFLLNMLNSYLWKNKDIEADFKKEIYEDLTEEYILSFYVKNSKFNPRADFKFFTKLNKEKELFMIMLDIFGLAEQDCEIQAKTTKSQNIKLNIKVKNDTKELIFDIEGEKINILIPCKANLFRQTILEQIKDSK